MNFEDLEKDNIDVVVVPESILQAIKHSSNLNINISDAILGSTQQKDEVSDSRDGTDLEINTNGNLWFSFANESFGVSCDSLPKHTIFDMDYQETDGRVESASFIATVASNTSNPSFQDDGMTAPMPLSYVLVPQSFSDNVTPLDSNSPGHGTPVCLQSNTSGPYVTMCVQNIVSDGERNILTLAPASGLNLNVQRKNALSDKVPNITVDDKLSNDKQNAALSVHNDASASKMPIVFCQKSEKLSISALDKGTNADSTKPVILIKCEESNCMELFESLRQYQKHKMEVHSKGKTHKCKSVDSNVSASNIPIISHQRREKLPVSTAEKGTSTNGPKALILIKCEESNCKELFESIRQYQKHRMAMHDKEKTYKCKYANCPWSFTTPYKLRRHLESHYKQKPFACPYEDCNATFSNEYNRNTHIKTMHINVKSRFCDICGEKLKNKRSLLLHLKKVHKQGDTFKCNICEKVFQTEGALGTHKVTHRPTPLLDCQFCEKKFEKRYHLKIHLYTHTGEKPFQCDQCHWGFACLSRLRRHKLLHQNEKRYKCTFPDCGKEFQRLHHLCGHLQKKHKCKGATEGHLNVATGKNRACSVCSSCGESCLTFHGLQRHKSTCKKHLSQATTPDMDMIIDVIDKVESSTNLSDANIPGNRKKYDNAREITATKSLKRISNTSKLQPTNNLADCEVKLSLEKDATSKQNETDLLSCPVVQMNTSVNAMTDLENTWPSSLISSDSLSETVPDSHYLTCRSHASDSQGSLVPFMEDMSVLNDAETHQFLQLSDDLGVESVTVTVDSSAVEEADNTDVLKQYVIGSNGLDCIIEDKNDLGLRQASYNNENCERSENRSISTLFDSDPLNSVDEASSRSTTHFSGTTININDIH